MATTLVSQVINRAKVTLQETTSAGTRWTNAELLDWLNESYQAIVQVKPDANTVNEDLELAAGTKQSIPASGLRLIDVIRSTDPNSEGRAIMICTRKQLDTTRRNWHREPETVDIEHYMFDELDPRTFYVYPPAEAGTEIEIVYSAVPEGHTLNGSGNPPEEPIELNDSYAPVMLDYIMYRAYSKDADHTANVNRAMMHYQAYMQALGQKVQTDFNTSPNQSLQQAPR